MDTILNNDRKITAESLTYRLRPWIIWLFGSIFLVYQFLLQTSSSVMIPGLEKAFSIDAASVGFLSSSFFYTYVLFQVPGGLLVDRFGPRKVLTFGMLICVISVGCFAHAKNFHTAGLSRMLMGFVSAPAFAGAFYLIAEWFPLKRFALVAGLTESFAMFGGMLGEVWLATRVTAVGWRLTLIECAWIGLICVIGILLIVRDRPKQSSVRDLTPIKLGQVWQHLLKVMGLPQVWLIGFFAACTFALVSAFAGLWCVPYLEARYQLPVTVVSWASSMIFIGVAIGCPCIGWLSDYIGKRKPVMFYSALTCLIVMCVILYLPTINFTVMFVLLFLLGFAASTYMLPFALIREITPQETRGTAMGFANMMAILFGSPIFQPAIGKLLEMDWDHKVVNGVQIFHITDYKISLSILPLCLLFALFLLPFIKETYCRETIN